MIDAVDQFFSGPIAFATGDDSPDLFWPGGVHEYMEYVGPFSEQVRCTPAHDNGVSLIGDAIQNVLHHAQHAVSIERLRFR
jgi:hypothetical protein